MTTDWTQRGAFSLKAEETVIQSARHAIENRLGGTTMGKSKKFSPTRRGFLKGAAVAGAATLGSAGPAVGGGLPAAPAARAPPLQKSPPETPAPPHMGVRDTQHARSDS